MPRKKVACHKNKKLCFCQDNNTLDENQVLIGCENGDFCEIEWFHLNCVGLSAAPTGPWFCPSCAGTTTATLEQSRQSVSTASVECSGAGPSHGCGLEHDSTLTPPSKTTVWLTSSIVASTPECFISRTDLQNTYKSFCHDNDLTPVSTLTLGKLLKRCFPEVTTRKAPVRLGSGFNHYGIIWSSKKSSNEDLGLRLATMKRSTPCLRRCPKGARVQLSSLLSTTLHRIQTENSVQSWEDLLTLPFKVLSLPSKDYVGNLTSWTKSRISDCMRGQADHLPVTRQNTKSTPPSPEFFGKKVEAKLADGDIHGALRLLLSDDTIAADDSDTLNSLHEKHPAHPSPTCFPDPPDTSSLFLDFISSSAVSKAISSFRPGSAGGLDGLRPQVLKDLISSSTGDAGQDLLKQITSFIAFVATTPLPDLIRPIFFGASLIGIKKKDGGIRPIAIGNIWRRLTSKVISNGIIGELRCLLSPHQLGVGIPGGAEAAAHAARMYCNAIHDSSRVLLKLDFKNAFNELRRDKLLQAVKIYLPAIFSYVSQSYQFDSNLYHGVNVIKSRRGVQQGDNLGPALFALTIHEIVTQIRTELNLWFLDDGTIGGDPSDVISTLDFIIAAAGDLGLELNSSKCELSILGMNGHSSNFVDDFKHLLPGLKIITPNEVTLLGAALGEDSAKMILKTKTDEFKHLSQKLTSISSHSAFFLLRASISTPRLVYFLRSSPMWKHSSHLLDYDTALKQCLEVTLNCNLTTDSWAQSSLPVNLGGLGINQACEIALPCFCASFCSSSNLIRQLIPSHVADSDTAFNDACQMWCLQQNTIPTSTNMNSQNAWVEPFFQQKLKKLMQNSTSLESSARLKASQEKHSGAWLQALPARQLGTHLDDVAFQISVGLRLGCTICEPHLCHCGQEVTSLGLHGLHCPKSAGRSCRHSSANDLILRALRTADTPCIREPPGLSRHDGRHPDGLTLVPWKNGKSLIWDFTCVDTYAPSYLQHSSSNAGYAANQAENQKKSHYSSLSNNYIFVAVAIETTGVFGKDAVKFIREIGSRIMKITGEKKSTSYLFQRLSIATQRGNAASVLGTLPTGHHLTEVFLL